VNGNTLNLKPMYYHTPRVNGGPPEHTSKIDSQICEGGCVCARLAILGSTPYVNYTGKLH
jgi:hypothetical protein